jgi:hypothetical protein
MLDGSAASKNHLMLRATMSGNESVTSGSSNSASDLASRRISPAPGRGRDGPTATNVDNPIRNNINNNKKRPRVDVKSAANPERKLETTNRKRGTAAEVSILSHKSGDRKHGACSRHGSGRSIGRKASLVCQVFVIVRDVNRMSSHLDSPLVLLLL